MNSLSNLDLISVGIAVAAIGILGFAVFLNNRKSTTSRAFLLFSIVSVVWSIVNYVQYQTHESAISFWILRVVLFLGVWHSFSFFQFSYVFPEESITFPKWYAWFYVPIVAVASLITIATPLVFSSIAEVDASGTLTKVNNGPLIPFVAFLILFAVVGGIILLIRKTVKTVPERKRQFAFVLFGMFVTFALLIAFNFLLPAFFNDPSFIPLGAIFLLPFVAFTFYSISRYHLLNMKVISTEILAFVISMVTLLEVVISGSFVELLLRVGIFILVLIFSFLLIKSVRTEVEQRELLEKLDKELEDKNKQLEDLGRFKSELLSLASHQIRSPLAAIKGFGTLIVGGSYGPVSDKVKETVGKMGNSANELIGLINTLLDLRKVEEGKMDYQMAPADLNKITHEVIDLLGGIAETKKLEFTYKSPDAPVMVNADAEKLKQVIQNLVDNSIKYTPSGFVHVTLAEENGVALVTVADSGVGIPATLVPHLFEEFIRDERVKKQILGTGLGLYIAKKIAEAHGGTMWAASAGEGKGSEFHVSIPLMKNADVKPT